jgi:hypothetical protein
VKKLLNQWPQVHFVLVLEMSDLWFPDRVQAGTPALLCNADRAGQRVPWTTSEAIAWHCMAIQ